MKKILALALAALCLMSLAACNGGDGTVVTSSTIATTIIAKPENSFYFSFHNQDLLPGADFPGDWLPAPLFVQDTPETVNGGATKRYDYGELVIVTYQGSNHEIIYQIILDPEKGATLPTAEGLRFDDSMDEAEAIYGTCAEKDGSIWTYRKGNSLLILHFENDLVSHIEYKQA